MKSEVSKGFLNGTVSVVDNTLKLNVKGKTKNGDSFDFYEIVYQGNKAVVTLKSEILNQRRVPVSGFKITSLIALSKFSMESTLYFANPIQLDDSSTDKISGFFGYNKNFNPLFKTIPQGFDFINFNKKLSYISRNPIVNHNLLKLVNKGFTLNDIMFNISGGIEYDKVSKPKDNIVYLKKYLMSDKKVDFFINCLNSCKHPEKLVYKNIFLVTTWNLFPDTEQEMHGVFRILSDCCQTSRKDLYRLSKDFHAISVENSKRETLQYKNTSYFLDFVDLWENSEKVLGITSKDAPQSLLNAYILTSNENLSEEKRTLVKSFMDKGYTYEQALDRSIEPAIEKLKFDIDVFKVSLIRESLVNKTFKPF